MKFLSTSTTILLSVTLAIAAEVKAPIKTRQGCSVTMFTGADFTGTSETFNGDVCSPVFGPFESDLRSAIASPGCVCFFFTQDSCGNCAACVDDNGFSNLDTLPLVASFRCEIADSAGCSNSKCALKK